MNNVSSIFFIENEKFISTKFIVYSDSFAIYNANTLCTNQSILGKIDEIAIYNRALSDEEILQLSKDY